MSLIKQLLKFIEEDNEIRRNYHRFVDEIIREYHRLDDEARRDYIRMRREQEKYDKIVLRFLVYCENDIIPLIKDIISFLFQVV